MKKIKMIHDFLVQHELVTENQLEVWTDVIDVQMPLIHPHNQHPGQSYKTQINILIKEFTSTQDIRAITLALGWWLNVHEEPPPDNALRMKIVPYIENRDITEVWIGLEVEEIIHLLADGHIESCTGSNWPDEFNDFPAAQVTLINEMTGEKTVLRESETDGGN